MPQMLDGVTHAATEEENQTAKNSNALFPALLEVNPALAVPIDKSNLASRFLDTAWMKLHSHKKAIGLGPQVPHFHLKRLFVPVRSECLHFDQIALGD